MLNTINNTIRDAYDTTTGKVVLMVAGFGIFPVIFLSMAYSALTK